MYFGDTARLPYGKRSKQTVIQYSLQAARFLHSHNVQAIVIACNTASSVALNAVQLFLPHTTIRGVVEAGARVATAASASGRIAVIGTERTVASKAYEVAITRLNPDAMVRTKACPFLVSLAEEGWTDNAVACMSIRKYLEPLFNEFGDRKPDCIILGCTHFSRFSNAIRQMVGPDVRLIDPADGVACEIKALFPIPSLAKNNEDSVTFHATDALQRFSRVGSFFLGEDIPAKSLQRVNLDNL